MQPAGQVGQASAIPKGAPGFSPTFFGFIYSHAAVPKSKKFVTYRIRRPERPPAGKIACHTKFARGRFWGSLQFSRHQSFQAAPKGAFS
jgi:hypothetical protein